VIKDKGKGKGTAHIQRHKRQRQLQQCCTSQTKENLQPIGCGLSLHARVAASQPNNHTRSSGLPF